MNDKMTVAALFANWREELGYDKAVLLSCGYPIKHVIAMSDYDAESEVEAIGDVE